MNIKKRVDLLCITSVLCLAILFFSCKKDASKTDTGSVKGVVSPANGVASIALKSANGGISYSAITSADGTFSFPSVSPGAYIISVIPTPFYDTPATVPVTVSDAATISADTIPLIAKPVSVGYTTSGGLSHGGAGSTVALSYQSSTFSLHIDDPNTGGYYYTLNITLPNVTTLGSFDMSDTAYHMDLYHSLYTGIIVDYWSADQYVGGSGSVTVSAIDTINHKIFGTFTGSLGPHISTNGTQQISGHFNSFYN